MDSDLGQNHKQIITDSKNKSINSEKRNRLLAACLKLDPTFEVAMAEEGMAVELKYWPEY
jgi:hypothetical protein